MTTTPTSPARLVGARLGALAAATAVAVSLVWLATLGWSLARGGRGLPDLRLLADAILAVILATWAGFAVGSWNKARLASLLAAFVWVAGSSAMANLEQVARLRLPVQWLSPASGGRPVRPSPGSCLTSPGPGWAGLAGLAVVLAGVLLLAARGSASRVGDVQSGGGGRRRGGPGRRLGRRAAPGARRGGSRALGHTTGPRSTRSPSCQG